MRALLIAGALVGCGHSPPTGAGARDEAVALWKRSGLEVSAFTPIVPSFGNDCATGIVSKVDVLVCNYASAPAATAAARAALQWVGDTTGSAQARGTLVIAAADRRKADPNGRTINQIFKLVPR